MEAGDEHEAVGQGHVDEEPVLEDRLVRVVIVQVVLGLDGGAELSDQLGLAAGRDLGQAVERAEEDLAGASRLDEVRPGVPGTREEGDQVLLVEARDRDRVARARRAEDFRLLGSPDPSAPPTRELLDLPVFEGLGPEEAVELARDPRLAEEVRVVLAADVFAVTTALRLWRLKEPQLAVVQLRAVDVLSHRVGRFDAAVDGAYRFVDQALAG